MGKDWNDEYGYSSDDGDYDDYDDSRENIGYPD